MKRTLGFVCALAMLAGACGGEVEQEKQQPEAVGPTVVVQVEEGRLQPVAPPARPAAPGGKLYAVGVKEPGEGWKSAAMDAQAVHDLRFGDNFDPKRSLVDGTQAFISNITYVVNDCGSYREPSTAEMVVFRSQYYGGACAAIKYGNNGAWLDFTESVAYWSTIGVGFNDAVNSWKVRAKSTAYFRMIFQSNVYGHGGGWSIEYYVPPNWVWGKTVTEMWDASAAIGNPDA